MGTFFTSHLYADVNVINKIKKIERDGELQNKINVENEKISEFLSKTKGDLITKKITGKNAIDFKELDRINGNINLKQDNNFDLDLSAKNINKYQDLKIGSKNLNRIYIFVSFSIPEKDLTILFNQSKQINLKTTFVFRGLIENLETTMHKIRNLSKGGVNIIIDPRIYKKFNIKVVPTFIYEGKEILKAEGLVPLNYVLEKMGLMSK